MLSDHKPLTFALSGSLMPGWHVSSGTSPTWPSILRISGTWLVRRMWWLTACLLSRPPEELSLPSSTYVASVKVPSGSLAAPVARDGSPGACTVAVVTPGPVLDMAELARAQESCVETQQLRAKLNA